ncbi:uncharacterized protein N7473_007418 [Penicillium subrubescens]|uniref:Uncharacterized protein n=1 Tax=Penicillium subrubescens TaxID=1316194 RepID=A0A1Q5UQG3_9EURO|nr:uncharacterized protein N7473_007418 [Penicillium subrubescens]KAJ5891190.1 hypothetical protein N7473_007418 [Penicillium subrubescens]OKP14713.1 hypothetical protein PENSUB_11471 [Penicillium subrubescens]
MSVGCLRLRALELCDPYCGYQDHNLAVRLMEEVEDGNLMSLWSLSVSGEAVGWVQSQEGMLDMVLNRRYQENQPQAELAEEISDMMASNKPGFHHLK